MKWTDMATIILIENSYDNFNRVILIIENILTYI